MKCQHTRRGVNAVSMRKSPELEAKAPDILRHQLVGGKVHTYLLSVQPLSQSVNWFICMAAKSWIETCIQLKL